MKKIENFTCIFIGFILKLFLGRISTRNIGVVGSSSGYGFTDNGKHLFLYCLESNVDLYFVTKSFKLYKDLSSKYGSKVIFNYSLRGLSIILRARYYFFTHNEADVVFIHNRKTKIVCLFHGMPIKCIIHDYKGKGLRKNKFVSWLFKKYAVGFFSKDISLIVATGEFFREFLSSAWRNTNVKVMSYPRIDYLVERLRNNISVKKDMQRILYMPTHRDYGFGELNPLIFYNDVAFQSFLASFRYEIKYRLHPNMKSRLLSLPDYDIIKEFLDKNQDSQDSLFEADVLISDFSSCVFDYLVCEKPIVFYHYDQYAENDNPIYFEVESLDIGPVVKTEEELKMVLTKIISDESYRQELIEKVIKNKRKYLNIEYGRRDYDKLFLE